MISFFDQFSQHYLQVSNSCNFSCLGCEIWKQSDDTFKVLSERLLAGRFFNFYKRAKVYNIVGGDPFQFPDLLFLCQFLKKESIKVRIWTNGSVDHDKLLQVLPYVDEIALSMPHIDATLFQDVTGLDGMDDLKQTMGFLKTEKISFFVHHKVTTETVSYLPNLYDDMFDSDDRYVLHYDARGSLALDNEEQFSVNYYNRKRQIFVFSVDSYFMDGCQYVPVSLFKWRFRWIYYGCIQYWMMFLNKYHL